MKKRSLILSAAITGIAVLFLAVGLYADTISMGPDVIQMENKAYETHKRGIVKFTHQKHIEEYRLNCGDCHHDKTGTPLASFKMGANAPSCINCHDVETTHEAHITGNDVSCGECHIDKEGKPLANFSIQKCSECHKIAAESPKGKSAPQLSKKERLQYHADAIHYNCKGCHREYNAKNKADAPTSCSECHPKKAKH
jgi:hypothetical protein